MADLMDALGACTAVFLETEINFGGEGGLYAELLHNRDFEALGRGRLGQRGQGLAAGFDIATGKTTAHPVAAGLDPHEPEPVPGDYHPWRAVGPSASVAIDNATAPFDTNPHSLRLRGAVGDGVANPGFWGIAAREGVGLSLRLFIRTSASVRLRACVRLAGMMLSQVVATVPLIWQVVTSVPLTRQVVTTAPLI